MPDFSDVKSLAPGAPETGDIAFTAKLTSLAPAERQPTEPGGRIDQTIASGGNEAPYAAARGVQPQELPSALKADTAGAVSAAPAEPARKRQNTLGEVGSEPAAPPNRLAVPVTVQAQAEGGRASEPKAPEAPPPPARTAPETPEQPKASTPAREIRLELAGGDRRVEVKLSDRGGEVRVAVRTPDGPLGERLRDSLPVLSSRLAESGFRTEAWHPSPAAGGEWRQTHETATAGSSEQSDPQAGQQGREQQQQRDAEPRRPAFAEDDDPTKEKGKDFAWLMSTAR